MAGQNLHLGKALQRAFLVSLCLSQGGLSDVSNVTIS